MKGMNLEMNLKKKLGSKGKCDCVADCMRKLLNGQKSEKAEWVNTRMNDSMNLWLREPMSIQQLSES